MLIEPLHFREFDAQGTPGKVARKKPYTLSGGKEEEPLPPPAPTFSEEQLKAAERDAYQKGFLDGTKDGHAQAQNEHADVDRILTETLAHFAKAIVPVFEDYSKTIHQLRQDMPKLALSIARKVAGGALTQNAEKIVDQAVLQSVESMISEPRVTVTVHERLAGSIEEKLKKLASRVQASSHITVQPDSNIPLADWRVEWKHGNMQRNTEQLWAHIDQAINDMLATTIRETNNQLDAVQNEIHNVNEKEQ